MRRIDLVSATLEAWQRLDALQRQRFAEAFLRAALRLERQELRDWLRRRLTEPPLAAPVDPARFAISKADIALLMKSARERKSDPAPVGVSARRGRQTETAAT